MELEENEIKEADESDGTPMQDSGTEYFVSTTGSDKNKGTLPSPFATLNQCMKKARKPGDQCTLRAGRYRGATSFGSRKGVTIAGYESDTEPAIIDGSHSLTSLSWMIDPAFHANKGTKQCVYRSSAVGSKVPWQLWQDDSTPLTPARWPNAKLSDFSVFAPLKNGVGPTGYSDKKSSVPCCKTTKPLLTMIDDGRLKPSMADSSIDFRDTLLVQSYGAMADQITGSVVESFDKSKNSVTYKLPDNFKWQDSTTGGHTNLPYFFEGHSKLLDAEEEWSYDKSSGTLLVWLKGCADPNNAKMRGRFQDVSLTMRNSDITIKNVQFFGTTFSAKHTSLLLENVTMKFPTFNKRTLGEGAPTDESLNNYLLMGSKRTMTMKKSTVMFNDPPYLFQRFGNNAVFEDNKFVGSCYSVGSTATLSTTNNPTNTRFEHNTVLFFNTMAGVNPGSHASIRYNRFSDQGTEQDGAAVHIQAPFQSGTVVTHNWISNMGGVKSVRCDRINTQEASWGENATITHNVAWNSGSIFVKGDKHTVSNNVVIDSWDTKRMGALCVLVEGAAKWAKTGENDHTRMENNIADSILNVTHKKCERLTGQSQCGNTQGFPLLSTNNIGDLGGSWWKQQLRDVAKNDFRPMPGSECAKQGVGAYAADMSDSAYKSAEPGSRVH